MREGFATLRRTDSFLPAWTNRYGPIRVEDVQADDVIRPENLPPNVPAKDFWSLLGVADSAGSSNNSICEGLAFSSRRLWKQHKRCSGDQRRHQGSEEEVQRRNSGLPKSRREDRLTGWIWRVGYYG